MRTHARQRAMQKAFRLACAVLATWALAALARAVEPSIAQAVAPAPDERTQRHVRVESAEELARMEAHLRSLYDRSDVRHSFRMSSGIEVDCVDIHKQPGLRRPGMENYTLATPPPPLVQPAPPKSAGRELPNMPPKAVRQASIFLTGGKDENGAERKCPPGAIPIRRITIDETKAFRTLEDFFRKTPNYGEQKQPAGVAPLSGPALFHRHAHAFKNVTNYGAHATLNIWSPKVQVPTEFSLSQIWVMRGAASNLETLEAGWQVWPDKYNDSQAHLFIYSTSDGHSGNNFGSGCYNLDCGRFIQTNFDVVIGSTFANYSVSSGQQYEVQITWQRYSTGWWLNVGNQWIGYYPLFHFDANGVLNNASVIDFGGEVIDDRTKHPSHTTTDMGSGAYASAGPSKAAYQRKLWYYNTATTALNATGLTLIQANASCYSITPVGLDPNWGAYFYFGGPGFNNNCQ